MLVPDSPATRKRGYRSGTTSAGNCFKVEPLFRDLPAFDAYTSNPAVATTLA